MAAPTESQLVALVTGASGGLGKHFVEAFLRHNYKVIAASRSTTSKGMLELQAAGAALLQLDPNASFQEIKQIINDKALPIYGHVDILINNAGFFAEGATEENTPEELESLFSANVFGPVKVTNALLPSLRARRLGLVMHVSSVGAHGTRAGIGPYCGTKAAISMIALAQRAELTHLNIEVTSLEPGYFRTPILTNTGQANNAIADYDAVIQRKLFKNVDGNQPGDPAKGAKVVVNDIIGRWVRSGCKAGTLTGRIPLGSEGKFWIETGVKQSMEWAEHWHDIVKVTNFDGFEAATMPAPR
ncbi:hypothetical protein BDZ91DRAFT_718703 [Kalaharituber pfeilii]|nr:hypothetical protein BDZ91DRAFT_718703 [Kalaharituber pfeilii]